MAGWRMTLGPGIPAALVLGGLCHFVNRVLSVSLPWGVARCASLQKDSWTRRVLKQEQEEDSLVCPITTRRLELPLPFLWGPCVEVQSRTHSGPRV